MRVASCEVCRKKPAATILMGHYLCGGCALAVIEEASDRRAWLHPPESSEEKPDPNKPGPADPWQLP